ncbi:MAG: hypothetical protein HC854_01520 [Flavobacterium sp.]|nr:hypothetical protein [Flavobacterium sp.]
MRKFYLCVIAFFLLASNDVVAQDKVVINIRGISTYYDKKDLEGMTKGQLMPLYVERVKILFSIIQYFGVTKKSGVTFKDLGIPTSKENVKLLESEIENREGFLKNNEAFLNGILPYSDTRNIVEAILFYQEVLKLIYTMQVE